MERLDKPKQSGLHGSALRTWGMLFVVAGILGKSILQNRLLGLNSLSSQQLLEALSGSQQAMIIATAALVLQAVETCGVPIFAFLLTEGFTHTRDWKKYLLRVAGIAVVSEIPFDLAMSGKVLNMGSQNPVFGLVVGMILLYFFRRYAEKSLQNTLIKALVLIAAMLWTVMLSIEHGITLVLMISVLWALRNKHPLRPLVGSVAAVVCTVFSPYYLASPIVFLAIHSYNGEPGNSNQLVNYLFYPAILLFIGLIAIFCF